MKKSIRDKFFEERAKEEAKNGAAIAKADQGLVKAVIKKEAAIGKKTTKQQAHQQKATDRVTKEQVKRGRGK